MDSAQEIENHIFRLQKPMNDVIERGDSSVQQFYRDATVFVTGGSGFIGKQLIEKLLRSCKIKKIYLLSRCKKGQTIQQRLQNMLKDQLYDNLRSRQPQFADKIVPVEGDVADIRLGLNEKDWKKLTNEVNIILHVAATVRFEEPLRKATFTNLRGTREALQLGRECTKLKKFVHISTAFTHATKSRIDQEVLEQFYPCPIPPDTMIALAENVDEDRLNAITKDLIEGWPNTYTFTKSLAEEFIKTSAGDLPVCIVRPPIVLPAFYEPGPGWLDVTTLAGPSGIYLGGGLGVIHLYCTSENSTMAIAPVDYVNNAIIAAGWDSELRRKEGKTDVPIYTLTKNITFGDIVRSMEKNGDRYRPPAAI
ncbi:fatty acyl-CoA reductase wat-like isoform X2 [Anticarsia gemmatalis]